VLETDKRYCFFYGGRAGGKSENVARYLLTLAAQKRLKILCCRAVQNSITDSVYSSLKHLISNYNIKSYKIYRDRIENVNGSVFIFKGLQGPQIFSVKSLHGIDICWVEEAQAIQSVETLDTLTKSIRGGGNKLVFTYNPLTSLDPVYLLQTRYGEISDVVNVNFNDNPYFLESGLEEERAIDEAGNREAYEHIWLGKINSSSLPLAKLTTRDFSEFNAENSSDIKAYIDPAFDGQDDTAIAIGYYSNSIPHIALFAQRLNCADNIDYIISLLSAYNVYTCYIEDTGNGGSLRRLFDKALSPVTFRGVHTTKNKAQKILEAYSVFGARAITYGDEPTLEKLTGWSRSARHDDVPDCWASFLMEVK
jgi:hypothetical protein